ncbi:hypothetical protein CBD41_07240 [bacterium TMED181]|nr:hypothetical protein [Planctomycetota bacterium]OUW43532.1 MAG: hypothetical protein CBD41_07240 [bacterium TMED181]
MSKELIYRFFGVAMMQKDLFLAMKRTSWLVTQWAYTAVIGFVLAANIVYMKAGDGFPDALWSTRGATEIVNVYMFMQLLLICIIFPFLSGSSITRERSEKTWALLKTTSLKPGELIRGKFFSLVCLGLYLLFLSAPLLVCITLLGGVNLSDVLFEYCFHISLIVWISAIGVLSSSMTRRGALSILSTPLFFFFPMLMVISLVGETYLGNQQMVMSMVVSQLLAAPIETGIIVSAVLISVIAALIGATHLISPENSTRSLPTRIGIFSLYLYIVACLHIFFRVRPSNLEVAEILGYSLFVMASMIPLLRIAGASPKVPLGIQQFARDHPFSSRALIFFTPGGIRNLLFCFLIIFLFIPAGIFEWQPNAFNEDTDLVRKMADIDFMRGLYLSSLFWIGSIMAFAWFLGQCGCSSILSASLVFTVNLIAVLLLTVLTIRLDVFWPAFSPNVSMVSTPFNLIQTIASSSARSFQKGFEGYNDGSIRMDTIFNVSQIFLFTILGCLVALKKNRALISRFAESDQGLLLDLPDLVEADSDSEHDQKGTAIKVVEQVDSSQSESTEEEQ